MILSLARSILPEAGDDPFVLRMLRGEADG